MQPIWFRRSVALNAMLPVLLAAPLGWAGDSSDLDVVHQIRQEALKRSQVMEHVFQMTDVYGPRLTRSPGIQEAAQWVLETAQSWRLDNVHLEPWGPFGRGWSTSYFSAHLIEPQYAPLIGVPLNWAPGTNGVVSGTPMLAPLDWPRDVEERRRALDEFIEEYRGKLAGQIVLLRDPPNLKEIEKALSTRFDQTELSKRAQAPEPIEPIDIDYANPKVPEDPDERARFLAHAPRYVLEKVRRERRKLLYRLNEFLAEERVRLAIYPAWRGDGGTVFPPTVGWHDSDTVHPPPSIALTPEHYNRLARLVENDRPCRIDVEVRAQFHEEQEPANVVAEIAGSSKADEVVIIGAHFDDVVYGTGATDNATGCAVMMEVMRILKTLDLRLDRTVRMVLWTGEEQGLLGSKAYVKEHFGDPQTMQLGPEHAKVSAYYNLDNGTGKIRGVYLQENDMVRPIFKTWLAPFADLDAKTLTIRKTGGTDHLSFDQLGIPGFQFIQDPVEYRTRTHHSNMDVYDRVQPGDLMQASAIIASFVYHTANRDDLLPRKPLPEPWPAEARSTPVASTR
jgi:hypothetical protein